MEKKNFLPKGRVIKNALAFGLGAALLSGCSGPNFSGEGNEFVVKGQVTDAGDQSLKALIYEINETHGEADGWFEIGDENRIHDNCDCHGFWNGRKQYGIVLDESGVVIEPNIVSEGVCVEFVGKIRDNSEGKYTSTRPVFDIAQIIPCDDQAFQN